MRVAVVYNSQPGRVMGRSGTQNREKYFIATIERILSALEERGHEAVAFEGDMDLISKLEKFFLSPVDLRTPGLVFNLAYGVQGSARYSHVPGILEMLGLPYLGSGPLAHGLALDKVTAKIILQQHGVLTPRYAVLKQPDSRLPEHLEFPLIVKPRAEASSFGLSLAHNEAELHGAVEEIIEVFREDALVEEYIQGREINVGLLGNKSLVTFPPVEIRIGSGQPDVFTHEDKVGISGRAVTMLCPAPLDESVVAQAQSLASLTFRILGCNDFARVDMRLDNAGNLYVLELNSLPGLNETASYPKGAAAAGLDFTALINELLGVAYQRYVGRDGAFAYITGTAQELLAVL
jgi:D-alanine-D-alanine ligase